MPQILNFYSTQIGRKCRQLETNNIFLKKAKFVKLTQTREIWKKKESNIGLFCEQGTNKNI